jgi:hypothetical protein
MECVGVTMVFAPTLLGVSWHSYSPTPGVSLLRTYDEAEGEVDRKAAVRVSGVFEGRLVAALASIKANLANPLSKLFRNCLKTEIESLKRISRVFERNGAFFS